MNIQKYNSFSSNGSSKIINNFGGFLYEKQVKLLEAEEETMSSKSSRAKIKIQKAILWININRGFFGQLLSNLSIYGSSELDPKTMCTNGYFIAYHPEFVLNQSDEAIRFVLCHEILHCIAGHTSRRGNRDPLTWNYAADYAINPLLNYDIDNKFKWPVLEDGSKMGLFEEKYIGMSAEDIYDLLIEEDQTGMSNAANMGGVMDADMSLPSPDDGDSIAQNASGDEGEGEDEDGEDGDGKGKGEGKGIPSNKSINGTDDKGSAESNLIGKKVRVDHGPNAGAIGTIKQVLPNGNIIIE